jgi:ABC-type enterochelin transport system substrate-binding protein
MTPTSEALRLAALGATTELHRLCAMVEQAAASLASVEAARVSAERALARAKKRQAQLKTAPADLVAAARAHLDTIDAITTEAFQCGAERPAREALRAILEAIEGEREEG